MREIQPPVVDPRLIYGTCVSSISDQNTKDRMNEITDQIVAASQNYHLLANTNQLYTIPKNESANTAVVLGQVTKLELVNLYSNQFSKGGKPGRGYYDALVARAPFGKCPYCALGSATTLDHYLPKSAYPQFSVAPLNLIPSCKDCNFVKSSNTASHANEQTLNPYYDHQHFVNDQWLFAQIIESTPPTVRFYINPPEQWDQISKDRLALHFGDFDLAARYKIEASTEFANIRGYISALLNPTTELIKEHLRLKAISHFNVHPNFWLTAMSQALYQSDWYCEGGYA